MLSFFCLVQPLGAEDKAVFLAPPRFGQSAVRQKGALDPRQNGTIYLEAQIGSSKSGEPSNSMLVLSLVL